MEKSLDYDDDDMNSLLLFILTDKTSTIDPNNSIIDYGISYFNTPDDIFNQRIIESKKRLRDIDLNIALLAEKEKLKPGQGKMRYGEVPKPRNILPFNIDIVNLHLNDDQSQKCNRNIGFTAKEFSHLFNFFQPALHAAGNLQSSVKEYHYVKPDDRCRLYVLLYSLHNNSTLDQLEGVFQWARSSIQRDIYHCAKILLDLLIFQMKTLWPNRAERDLMKTFLPDILKNTGIFFVVDSTKIYTYDSVDVGTRTRNFEINKGFGPCYNNICNIFGSTIAFEIRHEGSQSDITSYHGSDCFNQRNGCTWDNDETGMGDQKYTGVSNINPGSKLLLRKYTETDIEIERTNNRYETVQFMNRFNKSYEVVRSSIELNIKHVKRSIYAG